MKNFDKCFNYLLKDEGGYSNDPSDSGGATNLGITIGDYRKYIKADATPADVRTLTIAQAKGIYKARYWDVLGCDTLPSGVDNACFNYGVLAGIGRPRNDLKRFKDLSGEKLIDAICDEMKQFLINLANSRPKDKRFEKGWVARAERLRGRSHLMAAQPTDNKSGPLVGTTSGLTFWAASMQYFHNHPYVVTASAVAIGLGIWWAVHSIRNRNVNQEPIQPIR